MASQQQKKQEMNGSWTEFAGDLWRSKFIVFLFVFAAGVIGIFVAMWTRPVYEANALVQVMSKGGGLTSLLGDIGSFLSTGSPAETEIELIKSRRVMEPAIESSGIRNRATPVGFWNRLLRREGRVYLKSLYLPDTMSLPESRRNKPWILLAEDNSHFILRDDLGQKVLTGVTGTSYAFPYLGDSVKINVMRMETRKNEKFEIRQIPLDVAVETFGKSFTASERGKKTGMIQLVYQDEYPDRACAFIDSVAHIYARLNEAQSVDNAQKTLTLLEQQAPAAKQKFDSSAAALNAYRKRIGSADIAAETQITLETRTRLQEQILTLQQQRQEKVRLFSESHPAVKTLDTQIASLQKELSNTGSEVKKLPLAQQEIVELTGAVELNQAMYINMLTKIQQLRLIVSGDPGSARIIDPAKAQRSPVKPKRKVMVLISLFLGFCAASVFVSAWKKVHGGVKSARVIEKNLGINIYSRIPRVDRLFKNGMLPLPVVDNPLDEISERLRRTLFSVELSMLKEPSVLTVASPHALAGKSFVAANLGILFAQAGKKTLIIDTNFHKGSMTVAFKCPKAEGLAEVLMGFIPENQAIQSTNVNGLSVLTSGKVLASPSEILRSMKFSNFIDGIKSKFDIIIIDTPPMSLSVNAVLASRVADELLLVIEYGRDSLDSIRDSMAALSADKTHLHKSIVLNKYKFRRQENSEDENL